MAAGWSLVKVAGSLVKVASRRTVVVAGLRSRECSVEGRSFWQHEQLIWYCMLYRQIMKYKIWAAGPLYYEGVTDSFFSFG